MMRIPDARIDFDMNHEVHHSCVFVRMRTMKRFVVLALSLVAVSSIQAGPFGLFRRGGSNYNNNAGTTYNHPVAHAFLGSAQGVANHMATILRIGHFGGNPYAYEGVGMGGSPQAAIQNCCYYGRRTIADQGVCQGSNGMWYACCRYH